MDVDGTVVLASAMVGAARFCTVPFVVDTPATSNI
jgi:hypothetical protein